MEFDPHILHQIIGKIKQQLSCPQCSKTSEVEIDDLKVAGDDFLVFQMQCDTCGAHIVLHASLSGNEIAQQVETKEEDDTVEKSNNVSTSFHMESQELDTLRESLKQADGSFTKMFQSSTKE